MDKLITFLGTNKYKEITYFGQVIEKTTVFVTSILVELYNPKEVIIVMTEEAKKANWMALQEELHQYPELQLTPLNIPIGKNDDEFWSIFELITRCVNDNEIIGIDITYSFRSIPVIVLLSITYLKYVKNVKIQSLVYGAFEQKDYHEDKVPIIDLSSLLDILNWIEAASLFTKAGNATRLGELLQETHNEIHKKGSGQPKELKKLGRDVQEISLALINSLPKKVMEKALKLSNYNNEEKRDELDKEITKWVKPLAYLLGPILKQYSMFSWEESEGEIKLFIEKNMLLIDWYIQHSYIPQALSLMRELLITKLLQVKGEEKLIFEGHKREKKAGELYQKIDHPILVLWNKITNLRNDIIHAGTKREEISSNKVVENTKKYSEELREIMQDNSVWTDLLDAQTQGIILISPLGMSPGLLYSAILHTTPDYLIVITSEAASERISEVIERSKYIGKHEVIIIDEPFYGFNESARVVDRIKEIYENNRNKKYYVNLTGGTTALQYIVQKVILFLKSEQAVVLQTAYIDKRNPEEQSKNPYVLGNLVVIDN